MYAMLALTLQRKHNKSSQMLQIIFFPVRESLTFRPWQHGVQSSDGVERAKRHHRSLIFDSEVDVVAVATHVHRQNPDQDLNITTGLRNKIPTVTVT
jgi:hypothetical protein